MTANTTARDCWAARSVELMRSDHLGQSAARRHNAAGVCRLRADVRDRSGSRQIARAGSAGTYWWGGAAGTSFWIDPKEHMFGVFLIQILPPNVSAAQQFRDGVRGAGRLISAVRVLSPASWLPGPSRLLRRRSLTTADSRACWSIPRSPTTPAQPPTRCPGSTRTFAAARLCFGIRALPAIFDRCSKRCTCRWNRRSRCFPETACRSASISPTNPRTIFFNDSVAVGWVPRRAVCRNRRAGSAAGRDLLHARPISAGSRELRASGRAVPELP